VARDLHQQWVTAIGYDCRSWNFAVDISKIAPMSGLVGSTKIDEILADLRFARATDGSSVYTVY